jgi:hypothetical protein
MNARGEQARTAKRQRLADRGGNARRPLRAAAGIVSRSRPLGRSQKVCLREGRMDLTVQGEQHARQHVARMEGERAGRYP